MPETKKGLTPLDRLERLAGLSRRDDLAEQLRGYGGTWNQTSQSGREGRPES